METIKIFSVNECSDFNAEYRNADNGYCPIKSNFVQPVLTYGGYNNVTFYEDDNGDYYAILGRRNYDPNLGGYGEIFHYTLEYDVFVHITGRVNYGTTMSKKKFKIPAGQYEVNIPRSWSSSGPLGTQTFYITRIDGISVDGSNILKSDTEYNLFIKQKHYIVEE